MAAHANTPPNWRTARARVAGLASNPNRNPDDPELAEAKRDLKAIRAEDYVRSILATAPPLSANQRARLAEILQGNGGF